MSELLWIETCPPAQTTANPHVHRLIGRRKWVICTPEVGLGEERRCAPAVPTSPINRAAALIVYKPGGVDTKAKGRHMAHTAPQEFYCTFKRTTWLDPWLTLIPYRGEDGGLAWRRATGVEAYLAAVAFVVIATAVRVAVDPYIFGAQFFTFAAAVIVCTFIGGACVGLLAVLLSTVSAWYFLVPPYSFQLFEGEGAALIAFIVVGSLVVFLIGSLQAAAVALAEGRTKVARLEERLRAAEELRRWHDIFQHIAMGVALNDPKSNTVILANPTGAAMVGMTTNEIAGMSVFDLYTPAERHRIEECKVAADRNGHLDYEADCLRKDGASFPARIHNTSVRAQNGELLYRIVTIQDITRERQLEAELRQAQRLEAIGQLSAGVAHDFNNILQAIMSNLESVEDDAGVPPATAEKVDAAVRLAEQGAALTQQLLSFARKQALRPHRIDLGSFLDDFQSMMARSLDPRIKIDLAVEPGLAVWADESHLRNALINLAINARDAMPAGGYLRIEASVLPTVATREPAEGNRSDGSVVIRLTDTGIGIPPEHLSKVCDPFFSTKGLHGTGLGLSMVHGFAQQSGGALRINSEVGKGTCVELWLPHAPTPYVTQNEVA
jgi:PAS domain S-box-containing protein